MDFYGVLATTLRRPAFSPRTIVHTHRGLSAYDSDPEPQERSRWAESLEQRFVFLRQGEEGAREAPERLCNGMDTIGKNADKISTSILPRLIRLRDAPAYLGMDRNRFNAAVRPFVTKIPLGKQAVAFDRLDLDAWGNVSTATFIHCRRNRDSPPPPFTQPSASWFYQSEPAY